MKKTIIFGLGLVNILFLIGCQGIDINKVNNDEDLARMSEKDVVCNKPYIRVGTSCCVDLNKNDICDKDEVVKEKEIKEYTPTEEKISIEKTMEEYKNNLEKLGKVCILVYPDLWVYPGLNLVEFRTIRECSSDQECLDYIYSYLLVDSTEEQARDSMKKWNIRCGELTEEEKESVIYHKRTLLELASQNLNQENKNGETPEEAEVEEEPGLPQT